MSYTCIVIDDEPHVVEYLADCIASLPELALVKTYTNPQLALNEMLQMPNHIDFLFTDVEMAGLNGLALADRVKHKVNSIVLISGHDRYALNGYNVSAKGFLLKPFSAIKFSECVSRLISQMEVEKPFVWFKMGSKMQQEKVYLDTIIAIEAMGNYIKIYTIDKEDPYIAHASLASIEKKLKLKLKLKLKPICIQLNKSFLIFEKHILRREGDKIYLCNGINETVVRAFKHDFDSWFNKIMTQ